MFTADTIFYNGNIYTMKEEGDTVSAIVVYDEKILDMGTDEEMLKYSAKQIVDLHGKTVLPGFIDTHCHIAEAVEGQLKVDLTGITTIEEVISKMKEALPYVSEGKWLMGYQISERGIAPKSFKNLTVLIARRVFIFEFLSLKNKYFCILFPIVGEHSNVIL